MTPWPPALTEAESPLHTTLVDPATSGTEEAARIAAAADEAGTDALLVGGSTDVTDELVGRTVAALKEAGDAPVLLFPSGAGQFAPGLDGILFTVPVNSTRTRLVVEEPAAGAGPVLEAGLPAVTTAYVIVEPGMTVGEVAQADLVPRGKAGVERVARYASLAEVLGLDAVYLEAGSGAPDPVPADLVRAAAQREPRVVVGGGIREPEQARELAEAGADVVVTGTLAEDGDLDALADLVAALRGA